LEISLQICENPEKNVNFGEKSSKFSMKMQFFPPKIYYKPANTPPHHYTYPSKLNELDPKPDPKLNL
jgi:hypothetical protein